MGHGNEKRKRFDKTSQCCFNNNLKLCFINIPKNASSTIIDLFDMKSTKDYNSIPKDFYKIVVLRNPYDRAVSSFSEIMKLRQDGPYMITRNIDFYKKKSISLFLQEIENNFYDTHVFPQFWWIKDKNLELKDFDKIILFENFNEELSEILNKYNIKKNIKHINSKSNNYMDLNMEEKVLVNKVYADDIELYQRAVKLHQDKKI